MVKNDFIMSNVFIQDDYASLFNKKAYEAYNTLDKLIKRHYSTELQEDITDLLHGNVELLGAFRVVIDSTLRKNPKTDSSSRLGTAIVSFKYGMISKEQIEDVKEIVKDFHAGKYPRGVNLHSKLKVEAIEKDLNKFLKAITE